MLQVCFVTDAFLSPVHLLGVVSDGNNYRCIIMSLFFHYFFLAQFTWLLTQASVIYLDTNSSGYCLRGN